MRDLWDWLVEALGFVGMVILSTGLLILPYLIYVAVTGDVGGCYETEPGDCQ